MRRENRKITTNKSVYITGAILILSITAFVITFVIYSKKLDDEIYSFDTEYLAQYSDKEITNEEETTQASSSIGKTVDEIENNKEDIQEIEEDVSNIIIKEDNKTSVSTSIENKEEEKEDSTFSKPIEGEVIKDFAKDSLIYSETLKEWTTHLGVDIKAEKASIVTASADGIVKYIKNDPRYGLTIIIEHTNGYQTLYANLLTTDFISEGENVKAGQTIATVGDSSVYEIVDEPHLHFEIIKDGENLNPKDYIEFD